MKEPFYLETSAVRIHLILSCTDCDWETEDYLNGDKLAHTHVLETKHQVRGEYGLSVSFEP